MLERLECCAVAEYDGLEPDTKDNLRNIFESWFIDRDFNGTFILFTDVSSRNYQRGDSLTELIRAKKLGSVRTLGPKKNPNSTNDVKVYLWMVDIDMFKEYAKKNNLLSCEGYCSCPFCPNNDD